jgi:hypothetical protein
MDFWSWVHECEGYQAPRNAADAFHLASHNANTIAFHISRTIAHPNIINHGKSGITIVELLMLWSIIFDSEKYTCKKCQTSSVLRFHAILMEKK